jgi:hypothetical protein
MSSFSMQSTAQTAREGALSRHDWADRLHYQQHPWLGRSASPGQVRASTNVSSAVANQGSFVRGARHYDSASGRRAGLSCTVKK